MKKRLIIIEDEYPIALDIETRLSNEGYEIIDMGDSFTEAIQLVSEYDPDLVIMDIHLSGEESGIEAAKIIQESFGIPIVFLTAHSDPGTFERAIGIKPFGYVSKPFETVQLRNTIELALINHQEFKQKQSELILMKEGLKKIEQQGTKNDVVFIKDKNQLIRVSISSIFRLEAMDNYTIIYTKNGKHIVRSFLKDVFTRLPESNFIRVHRSHVINITQIDSIDGNLLFIQKEGIPISKSYRNALIERLEIL